MACALLTLDWALDLSGTELGGGTVTGPVLLSYFGGSSLLAAASLAAPWFPRRAGLAALCGGLAQAPIHLFFVSPGPFQHWTGGVYSVPRTELWVWSPPAVAGLAAIVVAWGVAVRALTAPHPESIIGRGSGSRAKDGGPQG
jgi:hypothetical protein